MPDGVEVTVEGGSAVIEFVDPSKRGPGLAALFAVGTPPELVEKRTRPSVTYTVPEGNARLAGLLDVGEPAADDDGHGYDDGEPDMDWSRPALNKAAEKLGLDPKDYSNKELLLDAIRDAKAKIAAPVT